MDLVVDMRAPPPPLFSFEVKWPIYDLYSILTTFVTENYEQRPNVTESDF